MLIALLARTLNRETGAEPGEAQPARVKTIGVRALLVDDNEINLMVGEEILFSYGIKVTSATSGMGALLESSETPFDIIFMDQMMPVMDGIETTRKIRAQGGPNRTTPIVALTANVVNDMRNVLLAAGMDDFIGKPIEISELSRVLRRWLPKEKLIEE
jgi:CheY-like chemotaxis protein